MERVNKEIEEMSIEEYWKELNEMYGTNLELPKEIKLNMSAVQFDIAMGKSFDGAIQDNTEVIYD